MRTHRAPRPPGVRTAGRTPASRARVTARDPLAPAHATRTDSGLCRASLCRASDTLVRSSQSSYDTTPTPGLCRASRRSVRRRRADSASGLSLPRSVAEPLRGPLRVARPRPRPLPDHRPARPRPRPHAIPARAHSVRIAQKSPGRGAGSRVGGGLGGRPGAAPAGRGVSRGRGGGWTDASPGTAALRAAR